MSSLTPAQTAPAISPPPRRWMARAAFPLASLLIVLAIYGASLPAPFIFDDIGAIVNNPHLRSLAPIGEIARSSNRPVVAFSLALNHAVSGLEPWSYRLVNILIHWACACVMASVIARTALLVTAEPARAAGLRWFGRAVALTWAVHPLNSEAVVYVIQRSETLMTLFALLVMYCTLRAWTSERPGGWTFAAITACGLGMASKENMLGVPLAVLLLDRALVSGGLVTAIRRRPLLYAGLFIWWALVAVIVIRMLPRLHDAGVGTATGMSSWTYLKIQIVALTQYLWLCFWPANLSISYHIPPPASLTSVLPQALLLAALLLGTAWGIVRRHWCGAVGALAFLVLAPTSSVVPMPVEVAAERRMHLPSAVVIVLVAAVIRVGWIRLSPRVISDASGSVRRRWCAAGACLGMAMFLGLGVRSAYRVHDYRTAVSIWQAAVRVMPADGKAFNNLGHALAQAGRNDEAIEAYRRATELSPAWPVPRHNLGNALFRKGSYEEAKAAYRQVIAMNPMYADASTGLVRTLVTEGRFAEAVDESWAVITGGAGRAGPGLRDQWARALHQLGRRQEAIHVWQVASESEPPSGAVESNLGQALLQEGRLKEAEPHLRAAIRMLPDEPAAYVALGRLLEQTGRLGDAAAAYEAALRAAPTDADALIGLGMVLVRGGRFEQAAVRLGAAAALRPDDAALRHNLGLALARLNQFDAALVQLHRAAALEPDNAAFQFTLGRALLGARRRDEAIVSLRRAVALKPGGFDMRMQLGIALAAGGDNAGAAEQFGAAARLQPDSAAAQAALARAQAAAASQPAAAPDTPQSVPVGVD